MNLLLTGAWSQARECTDELRAMGHEVAFLQWEQDGLPCDPDWVEGVVCNGLFLHHPMGAFRNLRFVQLTSAGYDRVDLQEVDSRGIVIRNARGVYSAPMAEFAVASVLATYKRLGEFHDQSRRHEWAKLRDLRELVDKRVLIVGCGSVGQACARRFGAFECKVRGVDLVPLRLDCFDEVRGLESLDGELTRADVVVVCVPRTERTTHLVKASLLKKGAILVNISRGATVDLHGLDSGSTAVLDVFEEEPLPADDPLWDASNVIITPHNSFVGEGNASRLTRVILANLSDEELLFCNSVQ